MQPIFLRFSRPRHPLLRALLTLAGLAVAVVLVVAGFFVLAVLAGVGALVWALRRAFPPNRTAAPTQVGERGAIEGEFVVLNDGQASRSR